jgi:hypothetical protein
MLGQTAFPLSKTSRPLAPMIVAMMMMRVAVMPTVPPMKVALPVDMNTNGRTRAVAPHRAHHSRVAAVAIASAVVIRLLNYRRQAARRH